MVGIFAFRACLTWAVSAAITTSGLAFNNSSVWRSSPANGAVTLLIPGSIVLNHGDCLIICVVATNFFWPPNNKTTWLLACQRSATRVTFVGILTLVPDISVTVLVVADWDALAVFDLLAVERQPAPTLNPMMSANPNKMRRVFFISLDPLLPDWTFHLKAD